MLPRFPAVERARHKANRKLIHFFAGQISPMTGMINSHIQFEGGGTDIHRYDQTVGRTPLSAVSASLTLPICSIEEFNSDKLIGHLKDVAEQMAKGMSEVMIKALNAATEETGNVVNAGGRPFSEELVLEMLEKIEHDFDPDGTWRAPTVVVGSGLMEKIRQEAEKGTSSLFDANLKKILDKKYSDYRHREADRVLVG